MGRAVAFLSWSPVPELKLVCWRPVCHRGPRGGTAGKSFLRKEQSGRSRLKIPPPERGQRFRRHGRRKARGAERSEAEGCASTHVVRRRMPQWTTFVAGAPPPPLRGTSPVPGENSTQRKRPGRRRPGLSSRCRAFAQNDRPSFISTQRPFWICCTWVIVVARWLVLEKTVGGELKMSRNSFPDSSASSIFWPVSSLPASSR